MIQKFLIQMTVCVTAFVFILLFNGEKAFVTNHSDLNKMIQEVQKNDGIVKEWSILAREELENISINDLDQTVKRWRKQFPQFKWEEKTTNDRFEIIGKVQSEDKQYVEKLQIVADLNKDTLQGFILYELNGTKWNPEIEQAINEITIHFLPRIFTKSPKFFSCIKGEFGDKIKSAIIQKALDVTEDFNGKVIETLEEEKFVSLTVNSPHFENHLQTDKGPFNLQIGLRNNENTEKTTFVIGTPILTIEY